jgi:hypothetical protein
MAATCKPTSTHKSVIKICLVDDLRAQTKVETRGLQAEHYRCHLVREHWPTERNGTDKKIIGGSVATIYR